MDKILKKRKKYCLLIDNTPAICKGIIKVCVILYSVGYDHSKTTIVQAKVILRIHAFSTIFLSVRIVQIIE